jgi:hypothetical protein
MKNRVLTLHIVLAIGIMCYITLTSHDQCGLDQTTDITTRTIGIIPATGTYIVLGLPDIQNQVNCHKLDEIH